MRFFKYILLALIISTSAVQAVCADNGNAKSSTNWTSNMLELKHQFLIEETGMTKSQQEQFLPLYEAMEKEIYQTNKDARSIASKVSSARRGVSDSQYEQAADALSNVKVREGEIEEKYYDRFSKILSKKQMFLLKRAETRFTRNMLTRSKGK